MDSVSSSIRLVLVGGGEFARELIDVVTAITLGRGRDVDVRVNHPLVSRLHCRLELRGSVVVVTDLGSLNGTFIGNQRVETELILPPNGLLTIGAVTFRAVYSDDPGALLGIDGPKRGTGPSSPTASADV